MPIGVAAAGIGVSALFTGIGQGKANTAASRAAATQSQGLDKQIAWEKEQETRRQEEWNKEQDELRRQFDAEQAQLAEDRAEARARDLRNFEEDRTRYLARETRLQPYRQQGTAAIGRLGDIAAQAGVKLLPVGQGQLTAGLPGAPGSPPYVPPPAPPVPQIQIRPLRELAPPPR
jgi:septal ring factor EnvC (AmiA/AmiB activator)